MVVVLYEGDFLNTLNKVGNFARDTINAGRDAYDYYTGKTDQRHQNRKYNFKKKALPSDIDDTDFKDFKNISLVDQNGKKTGKFNYDAKVDDDYHVVAIRFNAEEVPQELAKRVDPESKNDPNSLFKYITDYDKDDNVTMVLPMKSYLKDNSREESVMAPTPVSYEAPEIKEPEDSEEFLQIDITKDNVVKVENDEFNSLTLNEELAISDPKVEYHGKDDFEGTLEIEINGKKYSYRMKPGTTGKLPADIAKSVKGMSKYSAGKALQYLKKNMEVVRDESLNDDKSRQTENRVKMDSETFDKMCRDNALLRDLSGNDYQEVKSQFQSGGYDKDIAVNELWNGSNLGKSRDWYEKILNKYLKEAVVVSEKFNGTIEDQIRVDLWNKLYDTAKSEEFGFESNDDVDSYLSPVIDITDAKGDGHSLIRVEVRAELEYEGMSMMADALNEVVEKYDSNSYFDMVDPGIIEAYLTIDPKKVRKESIEGQDGWSDEVVDIFHRFSEMANSLDYELNNTVRGAYTRATTVKSLIDYCKDLSEELDYAVSQLESRQSDLTEGNSFKSHHICQGCGNTLDKCTCDVKEEDVEINESLDDDPSYQDYLDIVDGIYTNALKPLDADLDDDHGDIYHNEFMGAKYDSLVLKFDTWFDKKNKKIDKIEQAITKYLETTKFSEGINISFEKISDPGHPVPDNLEGYVVTIKAETIESQEECTQPSSVGQHKVSESDEDKEELVETIIIPGMELTSKSGNKIKINSVDTYMSDYDGSASFDVRYEYEKTDGTRGSSKCSAHDLFMMLHD